jgi:hypothetical protein
MSNDTRLANKRNVVVTFRLTPGEYELLGSDPNNQARDLVLAGLGSGTRVPPRWEEPVAGLGDPRVLEEKNLGGGLEPGDTRVEEEPRMRSAASGKAAMAKLKAAGFKTADEMVSQVRDELVTERDDEPYDGKEEP